MYRAMALYLYRNGIDADDSATISARCGEPDITIEYRNGEQVVLLNGENVNSFLRTPQVSDMASRSSVNPDVRNKLLELQQELARKENVVADLNEILAQIKERDERDMNRPVAPLKQADDAVLVDTSDLTIDEVVEKILAIIDEKI